MPKKKTKPKATPAAPVLNWRIMPYSGRADRPTDEVSVKSMITVESAVGPRYEGFFLSGVMFGWCTRGRLRIRLSDAKPIDLRKGQFTIVYGQRIVGAEALEDRTTDTNIVLSGLGAMMFADEIGLYDGFVAQDELPASTIQLLDNLVNRRRTDNSVSNAVIMNVVSNMLTGILDHTRMMGRAQFLNAVKCFNDRFAANDFSVSGVADDLGVSPNTLYLLFRDNGFASPGAFAEARQLRRARIMLANARLKIAEIARCCGFTSPAHFSVFIRKHLGQTPRELRAGTRKEVNGER